MVKEVKGCQILEAFRGKPKADIEGIIDTQLQMQAFEESVKTCLIPWLKGSRILKRNARLGTSLIDYVLECDNEKIYLEARSAVPRQEHHVMYPDCASSRKTTCKRAHQSCPERR